MMLKIPKANNLSPKLRYLIKMVSAISKRNKPTPIHSDLGRNPSTCLMAS